MTAPIKSGQALLDEFFGGVPRIDGVDSETAMAIARLFAEGKLTATNIANELSHLRESKNGNQTDED